METVLILRLIQIIALVCIDARWPRAGCSLDHWMFRQRRTTTRCVRSAIVFDTTLAPEPDSTSSPNSWSTSTTSTTSANQQNDASSTLPCSPASPSMAKRTPPTHPTRPPSASLPTPASMPCPKSPRKQVCPARFLAGQTFEVVELGGFEPPTFSLRTRRATNCAIAPSADRS